MSVARGFGMNGRALYANVAKPIFCFANFTVDSANGNGLGIRSLKSNGFIRNVFMHTSATPGSNDGALNPNPAVGYALVQFKNNFQYYLGGFSGNIIPTTSNTTSTTSGLTVGAPYVITVLGTTTLAEWQTIGLPVGLTPTVGQSFIAIATGTGGSHTGKVGLPGVPSNVVVSVVGDPNQSLNNSNIASNGGGYVLVQFAAATNSSTTTLVAAAPSDSTVIGMTFIFDGSSVTVDGI